jgi:hypothetical protein
MFLCLLPHDAEHLRNQSFLSRASVYDQYVHIFSNSISNSFHSSPSIE